MGKKLSFDDSDSEDEDPDMDAEMQAVEAIYKEKQNRNNEGNLQTTLDKSSGYNKAGLVQAVEDMGSLPFSESFQLCEVSLAEFNTSNSKYENDLDDLEREMSFYNHSLKAVLVGRKQLEANNIPHRRPQDFFCEHFKTDLHMARVSIILDYRFVLKAVCGYSYIYCDFIMTIFMFKNICCYVIYISITAISLLMNLLSNWIYLYIYISFIVHTYSYIHIITLLI